MKLNKFRVEMILAKKKMTRSDLANKCGLSIQRINYILNSDRLRAVTIWKISEALQVEPEDIM